MSRALTCILFAIVLAFPVVAANDDSDEDTTTLRVEVQNLDGKPVNRASVRVQFVKGRDVKKFGKKIIKSWQLKTNQEGWVKVPPLPRGDILVQVMAPRYQTYGQVHTVDTDKETIKVVLNPPQQQYSVHE